MSEEGKSPVKDSSEATEVDKKEGQDWSTYDAKTKGPPVLTDQDTTPAVPEDQEKPWPVDVTLDAKKAKELKKKLEKEAKMKKFSEKKSFAKPAADGDSKPKAKPDKSKGKEKVSAEELLQGLQGVALGEKKPVDGKLPDAYDPKFVEALWYSWWCKEGYFKPEYGLVCSLFIYLRCQFVRV